MIKKISFVLATVFMLLLISPKIAHAAGNAEIVMNVNTLKVECGSNIHARLEMASTTKIMTALVVIENANLSEVITADSDSLRVEGSSLYLKVGEQLTYLELLYGLMLRSGNDCANLLARATFGDYDMFIAKMNERAMLLDLKNTCFKNPHGLSSDGHYVSAYDLAVITSEALKNSIFARIVGTKSIKIGDRILLNKNKMLHEYEGAIGVKTGFTRRAGRCLVAAAKRNDKIYVSVVLNCYDMWERSKTLLDSNFENKM